MSGDRDDAPGERGPPLWIRLWHAVHALLFLPLLLTGWHLHYGGIELWGYDVSVRLHELLSFPAAALACGYPLALLFTRRACDYRPPVRGLVLAVVRALRAYTIGIFKGEPAPSGGPRGARLNPVQQLLYLPLLFLVIPGLAATGLVLLAPSFGFAIASEPLARALVATAHVLLALLSSLFFFMHLYMATMADIGRILPFVKRSAGLVLTLSLSGAGAQAAEIVLDRSTPALQCVGCHSGTPGSRRLVHDPRTGTQKDVTVELARLQLGVHGRLACTTCHDRGFDRFPHRAPVERRFPACRDCHPRTEPAEAAARDARYDFPRLEREHATTAHARAFRKERGARDCEGCHHPHYMRAAATLILPARLRADHDGPCSSCHGAEAKGPLADPLRPDPLTAHAALVSAARHLAAVRCTDCHASRERAAAHDLVTGAQAEGCTDCHRADSFLLRGLWRFVPAAAEPRGGFTNAGLLAEHYVIAVTRPAWLDRVAAVGLALLGLAIVAHAGLRGWARLRHRFARS